MVYQGIRILASLYPLMDATRLHIQSHDEASVPENGPSLHQTGPIPQTQVTYGTQSSSNSSDTDVDDEPQYDSDSDYDDDAEMKRLRDKKLEEAGGWFNYLKGFSILMPYLIPRSDRKVQACLLISPLILAAKRALNILVPRQLGIITDTLLGHQNPYPSLIVWFILSMANSGSGLGLIEALTNIPIKQFSYRQIVNASFNHVMGLPIEFILKGTLQKS